MGLYNSTRYGQPHAKTGLRTGAKKFLENLGTQLLGNTGAFIAYGKANFVSVLPR